MVQLRRDAPGPGPRQRQAVLKDHPEVSDEIEKIVRANSDRLLAAGKKGTVKPLDPSEVIKPAAAAEALPLRRQNDGQRGRPRYYGR